MKIHSIPEKTWAALQGRAKADPNYPQRKSVLEEQCVEGCLKGPQQGNDRSLPLQKFWLPRTSSKCFVISTVPVQISWTPGCLCAVQFPSTEQDSLHCVECPLPCAVRQDLLFPLLFPGGGNACKESPSLDKGLEISIAGAPSADVALVCEEWVSSEL